METNKIVIAFFAIALATFLGASPAHAYLAVKVSELSEAQREATHAVFTPNYETVSSGDYQLCEFTPQYRQQVSIGGGPVLMVLTDTIYNTGRQALTLMGGSCFEDYYIFGVGTCAC